MNSTQCNTINVPLQKQTGNFSQTIMVIYTYGPRATSTMKYSPKTTSSNNNKKNKKRNNKSKEVVGWDDIPDYAPPPTPTPPPSPEPDADATEPLVQSETKPRHGKWVHGTIPMSTIRRMKWGEIDELADEEFGYYQGPK